MKSSYIFPGFPPFVEAAAAELGRPETVLPERRIAALTDLANLCSQATHAEPVEVAGILDKAAEFRDHLQTALRAADLMLADVRAGCSRSPVPEPTPMPPEAPHRGTRDGVGKTKRGPR